MADHAKLSASGSNRWINCPGSVAAESRYPDEASEFAAEGTAAHEHAEKCLREGTDSDGSYQVQDYIDLVRELSSSADLVEYETRLDFSEFVPEGFGTADTVIIEGDMAVVVDLKYGKGVKVDAPANTQGILYLLGIVQKYQWEYGINKCRFYISQPRLDHVSIAEYTIDELLGWGDTIKKAASCALEPDAPLRAGNHCRFCKARFRCRQRVVDIAARLPMSEALSNADLGEILPVLADYDKLSADLKSEALKAAENGENIPGHKLVEGRSVRQFKDNAVEVLTEAGVSEDTIYRKSLNTLGNIEKALGGKKKAAPVMGRCTHKPAGKPALVKLSDPRPEIAAASPDEFM